MLKTIFKIKRYTTKIMKYQNDIVLLLEDGNRRFAEQKVRQKAARKADDHRGEPTAQRMTARECGTSGAQVLAYGANHLRRQSLIERNRKGRGGKASERSEKTGESLLHQSVSSSFTPFVS